MRPRRGARVDRYRTTGVLGRDVLIGITLDLHANVTRKMTELADIVVSEGPIRMSMSARPRLAAGIMRRTLAEIKPRTLRIDRPMLEEVNGGRTDIGPMVERIAKAKAYEKEAEVFAVMSMAASAMPISRRRRSDHLDLPGFSSATAPLPRGRPKTSPAALLEKISAVFPWRRPSRRLPPAMPTSAG